MCFRKKIQKKIYISGNSSSLLKILPRHTDIRPTSKTIGTQEVNVKKLDYFKDKISKFEKKSSIKN